MIVSLSRPFLPFSGHGACHPILAQWVVYQVGSIGDTSYGCSTIPTSLWSSSHVYKPPSRCQVHQVLFRPSLALATCL
jgi:hypothetical protein